MERGKVLTSNSGVATKLWGHLRKVYQDIASEVCKAIKYDKLFDETRSDKSGGREDNEEGKSLQKRK
jgi:hypothetical protein